MSTNELRVMDETGDTKLIWDPEKSDEVDVAETMFKKLKKKGYYGYKVKKSGKKGEVIHEFDPKAEMIIMAPAIKGG